MKKTICIALMITMLGVLSACFASGELPSFLQDKNEVAADTRIDQIVSALNNRDKEELRAIFSENALKRAENFDAAADDLFDRIQGEVISVTRDESLGVFDEVNYGKIKRSIEFWCQMKTDEGEYMIYCYDYPVDEIHPKNEGLYTLRIIRAEEMDELDATKENWIGPGIYREHKYHRGTVLLCCPITRQNRPPVSVCP